MRLIQTSAVLAALSILTIGGCGGDDPKAGLSAVDDASITVTDVAIIIDVLANDILPSDPAGFPLTILSATDGTNGVVTINSVNETVTYTPNTSFTGTDDFEYTIRNSDGVQSTATVQIVVAAAVSFDPILTIASFGLGPSAAAVADIDLDGFTDIAVVDQTSQDIAIFIQDSGAPGTFLAPVAYVTGAVPTDVAIGDLDDDGLPDVAVTNFNDNTVLVLFQDAVPTAPDPITFSTTVVPAVGANPMAIRIADFDGDTFNDFVTADSASNTISVVFQDPLNPGLFFAAEAHATGVTPNHLDVADLDVDGGMDVVIANLSEDTATVYFGNPSIPGDFFAPVAFPTGSAPTEVTIDDLNGDGNLDFALSNQGSTFVSVFFQSGVAPATFPTVSSVPAEDSPLSLVTGDFDADGRQDMVVTTLLSGPTPNFVTEVVAVILQTTTPGQFTLPGNFISPGTAGRLAAGLVDADANTDVVVPNFGSDDITVYFGN